MAMVSVKASRPVAVMMLAMLSGCAGILPVSQPDPEPKTVEPEPVQEVAQQSTAPAIEGKYLPQQGYDAQGKKIPYVAAPNPYTQQVTPVPAAAKAAFADARAKRENGDLRMARKGFRAMTKEFPTLSGPWVQLAGLSEQREKPEKAREYYHKALEVNPNNVNAYIEQAMFERRQGEFDNARDAYLAALQVWKDYPEAHLNLAILYDLYMNLPEEAQPHYEAYDFLTGKTDERVANWLIEIRRRTGIETSFIDNPPPVPEVPEVPANANAAGEAVSADAGSSAPAKSEEQG
ncbi:MAG: tetratricopeptide repeat protein [Gammaproteobacteria bacterium]|nr:MAG: tetratricopeptide repeat protein [Gammaproteobacteria bacterium]